jgi:maltose-binding protein MalE
LSGCGRSRTGVVDTPVSAAATPTARPSIPTAKIVTRSETPVSQEYPGPGGSAQQDQAQTTALPTEAESPAYPGPGAAAVSPTISPPAAGGEGDGYPGPASFPSPTSPASSYPGPGGPVSTPTDQAAAVTPPSGYPGPGVDQSTPVAPSLTATATRVTAQTGSGTTPAVSPVSPSGSPSPTPTERPIGTAAPPPQTGAVTVSIWIGWSQTERDILDQVLRNFQENYAHINFDVTYLPEDQLRGAYEAAAYIGKGPGLVFGPAAWGPNLFDMGLVIDLSELATDEFLERINPAALAQVQYQGALIGLPHAIDSAVVMYRNKTILPTAPATFDALVREARAVTYAGTVGAFLERSFFFSAAHLVGIGGQLMDQQGNPRFNDQKGVEWLRLLDSFREAGPVEFSAHRDLDYFMKGKAGIIIDGTWNLDRLADAIGRQNLAIDPWPSYGQGSLSGFIRTQNIYANPNLPDDQRYAALLLMGFILTPEVQGILSQVGHIPVVSGSVVEDALLAQAAAACEGGTPYPILPEINAYWGPLETAMQSVFNKTAQPSTALQQAHNTISNTISDMRSR